MAWLRADGAFVVVSTVGAPTRGHIPRHHVSNIYISNALFLSYHSSLLGIDKSSITNWKKTENGTQPNRVCYNTRSPLGLLSA